MTEQSERIRAAASRYYRSLLKERDNEIVQLRDSLTLYRWTLGVLVVVGALALYWR